MNGIEIIGEWDDSDMDEAGDVHFTRFAADHVRALVSEYQDGTAILEHIEVDEGFRGQGLGTAAIIDIVKAVGSVYIVPNNADAARLYARIGDDVSEQDLGGIEYCDQGYGIFEVF